MPENLPGHDSIADLERHRKRFGISEIAYPAAETDDSNECDSCGMDLPADQPTCKFCESNRLGNEQRP